MDFIASLAVGSVSGGLAAAFGVWALQYMLNRNFQRIDGLEKHMGKMVVRCGEYRAQLTKDMKASEDCVEGELKDLNRKLDGITTYLIMKDDDPRARAVLKGGMT